ncbi:MAG: hypothetical protein IPP97_06740 [Candidatus Obscuribacter sp.]|jgi:hypothetical protein|nr:hypothetical protein [Candidatus Obscuribacter sp.]MBP6347945.1 hypothetical protein [Candidatus Obscuribacter sp.]MBP6591398.1 hypothetical protein [Candidatus Obscuribacter sp.]MBP7576508.1 hypothetical protein [Candidatus Obscuribacter sp.]
MTLMFNETELRVAILQIVLKAQKRSSREGPAVHIKMVTDIIGVSTEEIAADLNWLIEQHHLQKQKLLLAITDSGIAYLADNLGPDAPPTSPSKIPKIPNPNAPDTATALPLPED